MKKYIDCDGVILDTETGLFDNYYIMKQQNNNLNKITYLQNLEWESWINQAQVINDAIEILKNYNPKDTDILTKVHSLQEARAKITYFRERKVKNNIIIVPDIFEKSCVASSAFNILVDDNNKNLNNWQKCHGISIYFGNEESIYPRIESLEEVLDNKKLAKIIGRMPK